MKTLVIGHEGGYPKQHFADCIVPELNDLAFTTDFLKIEEIQQMVSKETWNKYRVEKEWVPLSRFILFNYDFIIVDQCDIRFHNDLNIPVAYNQKYIHRRESIDRADIVFFLTDPLRIYFQKIANPQLYYKARITDIMYPSFSPTIYQPQEKTLEGITYFGSRNNGEETIETDECIAVPQRTIYRFEEAKLREYGFRVFETPFPTPKYRECLPKCEEFFMSIPRGQYVSRMIFEAMACKTMTIIQLHSEKHEGVMKDLGFENMVHYVGVKKLKDLLYVDELVTEEMKDEIVENAYNVVMSKHTYRERAKQIIEVYKQL